MNEDSRPLLAATWMSGAIVAFTFMAISGRELSTELDTFEMMMYRSCVGLIVVLGFGFSFNRLGDIRARRLPLHILRNICHFTGQNLWFYALTLLTFAQVFALEFTTPIWVIILAVLFLGEKISSGRIMAVALGFAGVMAVARPGGGASEIGLIMAAASAVGFAGSLVTTKLLTRSETILSILFWMTAIQAVFGLLTTGWDGDIAWPSAAAWPWLVLLGIGGLAAHTCITNALKVAPATVVVPLDFMRLPVIAIVGMLFYAEPMDAWVFLGAGLIFFGNYVNILSEAKRRRD